MPGFGPVWFGLNNFDVEEIEEIELQITKLST